MQQSSCLSSCLWLYGLVFSVSETSSQTGWDVVSDVPPLPTSCFNPSCFFILYLSLCFAALLYPLHVSAPSWVAACGRSSVSKLRWCEQAAFLMRVLSWLRGSTGERLRFHPDLHMLHHNNCGYVLWLNLSISLCLSVMFHLTNFC